LVSQSFRQLLFTNLSNETLGLYTKNLTQAEYVLKNKFFTEIK